MNHRHLLTVLKLSLAAVVIAAIGVSQAHALDSKVYPGLMCINRYTTGIPIIDETSSTAVVYLSREGYALPHAKE